MSAEDLSWAAETLVEAERRRCVSRVCSVDAEDAEAKGDNFSSDIRRLKMTVVLHSGEVQQRSLIYKALPKTPHRKLVHKNSGTFATEVKSDGGSEMDVEKQIKKARGAFVQLWSIWRFRETGLITKMRLYNSDVNPLPVFTDVLAELKVLIREKEADAELLWPEFFGVQRRNEGLLLEDLCVKGYTMLDRQRGMNFEHAVLVVRFQAKFHALAAVLRERRDLNTNDFDRSYLADHKDEMLNSYKNSFVELSKVLESIWKGKWTQYVEKLRNLPRLVTENVIESYKKKNDEKFYTLNHGDCWLNNIMFRYGRKGEPVAVRFIDFQMCHYNHPGFDLQYFFQTSLDLETRPRKTELLREYHSSLEENLKFFGYTGAVPSYADILECYKSVAYFGLGVGLRTLPMMLIPPDKAPDMEDISEKMNKNVEVKLFFYDHEGAYFMNTLKFILKEADDNGLLH